MVTFRIINPLQIVELKYEIVTTADKKSNYAYVSVGTLDWFEYAVVYLFAFDFRCTYIRSLTAKTFSHEAACNYFQNYLAVTDLQDKWNVGLPSTAQHSCHDCLTYL